jgi:hypothetical protein
VAEKGGVTWIQFVPWLDDIEITSNTFRALSDDNAQALIQFVPCLADIEFDSNTFRVLSDDTAQALWEPERGNAFDAWIAQRRNGRRHE